MANAGTTDRRFKLMGFKETASKFVLHHDTIPFTEIKEKTKEGQLLNCTPAEEGGREEIQLSMANMSGTFITNKGLNTWRVIGLSHHRPPFDNISSDLDVIRLPGERKNADGVTVEVVETTTDSKVEYILRICRMDSPEEQKRFMDELKIVKEMRSLKRANKRVADVFPRFMAADKMKEMDYTNENKKYHRVFPSARPFYIIEKIEPNLETIMKSAMKKSGLGSHTSVFLTMGIFNALRHLHHEGYIHRNVQPSEFAVRLGPHGKLSRSESELSYLVAIVGFSLCRKRDRPEKSTAGVGVPLYNSPAALIGQELSAVDDCLSAMYIFYEMVTNSWLPWWEELEKAKVQKDKAVIYPTCVKGKLNLESVDKVTIGEHKDQLVFSGLNNIFKEIRKANGFTKQVDYDAVIDLLRKGLKGVEEKIKDTTIFGFQQPVMMAWRHGVENKDGTKNSVVERDDVVCRINHLFPNALQKVEPEDKKEKEKSKSAKKKK